MKTIPQHTLDFIDSWLRLTTKWEETTGLAVAVMYRGEIVLDAAYGSADVEREIPLASDYRYRVASQTKTFTAVAVLQLQEQGKLRIDDPVIEYLPWLAGHKDTRMSSVTIRQLLSHSAGLTRDGESSAYWTLHAPFPTREVFQNEILALDLVLEPNTTMKYSNYGYALLGMIIESASGREYATYITEHIIEPLELHATTPELPVESLLATGYSRRDGTRRRYPYPSIATNALIAATGICSTPADLCRFFAALHIGSGKLLTDTSKREMQRKHWEARRDDDSYGLGVERIERDGKSCIGHSGGFPGFASNTQCMYDDELIVSIVVTEHDTWSGPIVAGIFSIIRELGEAEPEGRLLKYEGRFVDLQNVIEIVATSDGLRLVYPCGWWPMNALDKLRVLDESTLEIYDVNGYEDEGEKYRYTFSPNGTPVSIMVAGEKYLSSPDGDFTPWW